MLAGLPITNEFDEDGKVVQYFERLRFEWHPGSGMNRHEVLFGRTGAEALELREENAALRIRISKLEQAVSNL